MNHRHRLQPHSSEHSQTRGKVKELPGILVLNVELEKVMRQLAIIDGMFRVKPFTVEDELTADYSFQHRTLYRSPLLEEIVLRMHPFRYFVAAALEHHAPA